jgi:hypothetical protein
MESTDVTLESEGEATCTGCDSYKDECVCCAHCGKPFGH